MMETCIYLFVSYLLVILKIFFPGMKRSVILLWSSEGIVKAWYYLFCKNLTRVKLDHDVRRPTSLSEADFNEVIAFIDSVVHKVVWWSKHICFYRSFCRCLVLRRIGYLPVMNVGLRNLNGKEDVRGHCWLSLHGRPFYEKPETERLYPIRMGELRNGILCWVQKGSDTEQGIMRVRTI